MENVIASFAGPHSLSRGDSRVANCAFVLVVLQEIHEALSERFIG